MLHETSRSSTNYSCHAEKYFHEQLGLERKRSERSKRPLLLMTINFKGIRDVKDRNRAIKNALKSLALVTRAPDLIGWYEQPSTLGVLFTEIGFDFLPDSLQNRILETLRIAMDRRHFEDLHLRFHSFPEQSGDGSIEQRQAIFYSDVARNKRSRMFALAIKRSLDIFGSIACMVVFSPCFLLIPLGIKLTSPGPLLFRQERVGEDGKKFAFLKFRSMHADNNPSAHRLYVQDFIAGAASRKEGENGEAVYKLTNDGRITPFGHFLRKTSLDELPQFFNVLTGAMSLVGPRPPIPYEFEKYDVWHQRRVIEVKPGITGLWQVSGRSSTTFDEMVRLDLRYAREWSLWTDIKILIKTPVVVLVGRGAL